MKINRAYLLYIILFISINIFSYDKSYMNVTIQSYKIKSICPGNSYAFSQTDSIALQHMGYRSYNDMMADRSPNRLKLFEIIIKSKYRIFHNYNHPFESASIGLSTPKYNIEVEQVYGYNKEKIGILIEESNYKKLLKDGRLKILYPPELFSKKLLQNEFGYMTPDYNSNANISSVIYLYKSDLENSLNECNKNYDHYLQLWRESQKPLNRLKNYFGF